MRPSNIIAESSSKEKHQLFSKTQRFLTIKVQLDESRKSHFQNSDLSNHKFLTHLQYFINKYSSLETVNSQNFTSEICQIKNYLNEKSNNSKPNFLPKNYEQIILIYFLQLADYLLSNFKLEFEDAFSIYFYFISTYEIESIYSEDQLYFLMRFLFSEIPNTVKISVD